MKKVLFLIIALMLIFGLGCSKENVEEEQPEVLGVVSISPSKLLEGDMRRLNPHLGLKTGCVKIKYRGNKKRIATKYEIWEKGKLKNSFRTVGMSIDGQYEGELSVFLQDFIKENMERQSNMVMTTSFMYYTGSVSSTEFVRKFKFFYTSRLEELVDTIKVRDDEEVAVWAYTAMDGSSNVFFPKATIEDAAKDADWALVLKLYFED